MRVFPILILVGGAVSGLSALLAVGHHVFEYGDDAVFVAQLARFDVRIVKFVLRCCRFDLGAVRAKIIGIVNKNVFRVRIAARHMLHPWLAVADMLVGRPVRNIIDKQRDNAGGDNAKNDVNWCNTTIITHETPFAVLIPYEYKRYNPTSQATIYSNKAQRSV